MLLKRIVLFILLKIVEIGIACLASYLLIMSDIAFFVFICIAGGAMVLMGLYCLFVYNWQLVCWVIKTKET